MTHLTAQDDKPWGEWMAGKGAQEQLGDYGVLIVLAFLGALGFFWLVGLCFLFLRYA